MPAGSPSLSEQTTPDALLCLSSQCPHCPAILQFLTDLVKQGRLGRLEVVNLERRPEIGRELDIRSVPWVRIGAFELTGTRSRAELESWVERAGRAEGMAEYFHILLKEGELAQVISILHRHGEHLAALLPLVADLDASLNVRLGAGAVFEEFAGQAPLQAIVSQLGNLTTALDGRVRADACHYLGLTGSPLARPYLEACLRDSDAAVREIAEESLAGLDLPVGSDSQD